MKCLITGGAGFIGSTIAYNLLNKNHEVLILDNLSTGNIENIPEKASFIQCDLSSDDQSIINSFFSSIDIVFHCAALPNVQYSVDYPKESNNANVDSTIKTLEACVLNSVKKIIYSGSCSAYGDAETIPTDENCDINPLSPYALQKYIGEEYCRLYHRMYNLDYVILRYFNVYGEKMSSTGAYVSVLSRFLRSYYAGETDLNITNNGNQRRDFVYVQDIAEANILCMEKNIANDIFNVGSGDNVSVNELADVFGLNKKYGEKRIEPYETLANISKISSAIGWKPNKNVKKWIEETLNKKV
jgi:nucleoside-diphosphate-sugar epimerase